MKSSLLLYSLLLLAEASRAHAVPILGGPSGWPGIPHHWAPALKQAVGTAYEPKGAASPVWFTISEGIMSEVFYPSPDQAQVGYLEFIVTDGKEYFSEQRSGPFHPDGAISKVEYKNEGLVAQISGEDKRRYYHFDQTIFTDTSSPSIRIHTRFTWNQPGLRVFVLLKPTINNSVVGNLGFADKAQGLFAAYDASLKPMGPGINTSSLSPYLALVSSARWTKTSAGYVGFSDGWQDLLKNFQLTSIWDRVESGNVSLTGEVQVGSGSEFTLDLALSFGSSRSEAYTYASTFLKVPIEAAQKNYETSWLSYLNELQNPVAPTRTITESSLARRSAQIIKIHENKLKRGAIVTSLSKPTIPSPGRNIHTDGGFHLIWPKDLYLAAMSLLAAGDTRTPIDVLHYFKQTQQRDGSWPLNFWIDGTPYLPQFQPDDAAYFILLASQLEHRKLYRPTSEDLEMIRKATAFILSHGPLVSSDRWGETGGYTPSALATQIAALKCSSQLTQDLESAQVANQWQSSIEKWNLVSSGSYGTNYYARNIFGTASNELLDGGFLDLVKMGIREPQDPRILNSLKIYEDLKLGIAVPIPEIGGGLIYHPNNQTNRASKESVGYFPYLSAERGHYAVAAQQMETAQAMLYSLEESATPSRLFPEQLSAPPSSKLHVRLGVACPFVPAHAVDILLRLSIEEGTVFDAPFCK